MAQQESRVQEEDPTAQKESRVQEEDAGAQKLSRFQHVISSLKHQKPRINVEAIQNRHSMELMKKHNGIMIKQKIMRVND